MRDKRKAFVRLAEQRTSKVLKGIDILGHCANPNLYEWTDGDVEAIFHKIEEEIETAKAKFERRRFQL